MNKVSTAVELRFEAARSPHLPEAVKRRLRRLAGQRWTKDGAIVIFVQETRSQNRNREIARDRLRDLIVQAAVAAKPRIATRPHLSAVRRRLETKKQRGAIKKQRAKPDIE